MANLIDSKLLSEEHLASNGGIFHVNGFFTDRDILEIRNELEAIEYSPLLHENTIARYECDYGSPGVGIITFKQAVMSLAVSLGMSYCKPELYCFKYVPGHSVPWHKDMDRHIITAIAYFGEFSGGEYVYKNMSEKIIEIEPKQGDVVVSINKLTNGVVLNPLHKVNEIQEGTRYCSVVSITSSKQACGTFSS